LALPEISVSECCGFLVFHSLFDRFLFFFSIQTTKYLIVLVEMNSERQFPITSCYRVNFTLLFQAINYTGGLPPIFTQCSYASIKDQNKN
jgi:hypothetical protein